MKTFFFLLFFKITLIQAQTFSLSELEDYSTYNFDQFSNKLLTRGYEVYEVDKETVMFKFSGNPVKNIYTMTYYSDFIIYGTSYKENHLKIESSMKSKGYEYVSTETYKNSNQVCLLYNNSKFNLNKCYIGTEEIDGTPLYMYYIQPQIIEE